MVNTRRIVDNPQKIRDSIHRNVEQSLRSKFPLEAGPYIAELKNVEIKKVEMPHARQRDVLLAKGNASDGVYVDISLKDKANGKSILTLNNHRILNIPYFTNRYTMIVDGSEYSIVNQMRTKSGVYTRKRGNDELESSFNLSKGANFKLVMAPNSGKFSIHMLGSTLPMYAVLKILGANDQIIRNTLGEDLYRSNSSVTTAQMERTRNTLFSKLAAYKSGVQETATSSEKEQKIREYFSNTEINPETTKITLGKSFSKVNYEVILEASKKILRVFNEEEDYDERDNLEFQKVYSVEDIIKEVLDKNRDAMAKMSQKLKGFVPSGKPEEDRKALKLIFSSAYLSKPVRNFITTSSISRMPSQINPMEILDSASIVTRLGEGAISSEDAVPDETRSVNYSYMGTIDPIATPESSKVGIDNRLTVAAVKGDDNEFYREVRNTKTGKMETNRVIDMYDKHVGFPDPLHKKDKKPADIVPAVHKGKLVKVRRSQLDYQTASPHDLNTATTSSLPFVNANQANRIVMGAKHVQQALPLKDPDTRLVRSSIKDLGVDSITGKIGDFLTPKSPVDGTVTNITDDYVHIRDKSGKIHKVDYENNLPLATKTLLHNDITVKVGDKVKKGQALGGNNYAKDGELAVGKNLSVAYMPYEGMNHEDGVVISESAARKMTSVHGEKVVVRLDKMRITDKSKFATQYPTEFTKKQLSKLDKEGVVKKGQVLEYGDPVVLILEDDSDSRRNQVLGALHKSLVQPYRNASEVYEEQEPAEVLEVSKNKSVITVLLKIEKPLKLGDKLAGSFGNKGVVTKIVNDDEMVKDADGNPVDTIFTSAGVIGRINPAQTLETALGKVAKKTGKRYDIENFAHEDYVKFVKDELQKHGVKDKETLTDPRTGKKIDNVFIGQQHIHKLFKTTDSNYSARGIEGPYDQDEAPTGSGEEGPKALGGMEVNALIAHNVRDFLKDSTAIRSSKNTEFWNAFKQGQVAHFPTEKKTFSRFVDTLRQAGINVEKKGDEFIPGPLTDEDIKKMSSGEVKGAERLRAKDLAPEAGGLFDENIFGGLGGDRWGHIKLPEPVVNPVFEDTVRHILGVSSKELTRMYAEEGGDALRKKLNDINVGKELKSIEEKLADTSLKGASLDNTVKKYKYLKTLRDLGKKPGDAYTLSVVPVTPPTVRPITVSKTGDLMENDANYLYRDLVLQKDSFEKVKEAGLSDEDIKENRKALADRVRELTGFSAPASPQLSGKGVKGAASFISGDSPKHGYFQRKVVYSKMNTSGRATIVPDTELGLDEIGIPEKAAWEMYKPFIIRGMAQRGYSAVQAREEVNEKSDFARQILLEEMEKRPVVTNRAPTLWRHSMLSAKPKLRDGKNLHINTVWESGLNSDFDGDSMQMHVPVSDEAVEDAKKMMPSKQLFSDKKKKDLLMIPKGEPVFGLYKATQNLGGTKTGKAHKFSTEAEAWKAYHDGTLKMTDVVEIG